MYEDLMIGHARRCLSQNYCYIPMSSRHFPLHLDMCCIMSKSRGWCRYSLERAITERHEELLLDGLDRTGPVSSAEIKAQAALSICRSHTRLLQQDKYSAYL